MADLSVKYMGLNLKSPLIVGASNLVTKPEVLEEINKSGAGAVVYKSLFEEQIQLENLEQSEITGEMNYREAEMADMFPNIEHAGPKEHLYHLKKAKELLSIPLIASLNAVNKATWVDYAQQIVDTGVDGLELNFFAVPADLEKETSEIIFEQIEILTAIKSTVNIPVSVKLSHFYANILNVVKKFNDSGADAVILFNRLFEPEIDITNQTHIVPFDLSQPGDYRLSLRYSGLLYGKINASICASSGIYQGTDIAKMILAGADAVQVVSAIYKYKTGHIRQMLNNLEQWMDENNYKNLEEFRGKLSAKNIKDKKVYRRAQYIDLLLQSEDIFKKYPMI
jgi:dihydroorotate dehydrogenase (fumarate)